MLGTRSTSFQKLKIEKLSNVDQNQFQNSAHLLKQIFFFQMILRIWNDHISKTKNRIIDFTFVSDHCVTFLTKKTALLELGADLCVVD